MVTSPIRALGSLSRALYQSENTTEFDVFFCPYQVIVTSL